MRVEPIEVYSDDSSRAILRHPNRKFPGALVQGDSLAHLCSLADKSCEGAKGAVSEETYSNLNELRNTLWAYLTHYKAVLIEHDIPLPFSDRV